MGTQILVSFVAGLVFAAGLALSGMTLPQNIIGFLNVRDWNPALILVMVGAITVYAIAFRVITKRAAPLLREKFEIPTSKTITWQLVVGAALFGIGWGLGGFCGGPAIASLAVGGKEVVVFVAAMLAGTYLCKTIVK